MADFCIAAEDQLSEAVAERLVVESGHRVAARIPKDRRQHGGFGYLRARLDFRWFPSSSLGTQSWQLWLPEPGRKQELARRAFPRRPCERVEN
jgi:hypothetical protein